jgi:hypothetical protein
VDNTDVGLNAVIRSLSDVITPAVNPDSALAREQLRLSIEYLRFAVSRIDFLYARAEFEARHHLRLATAVCSAVEDQPARTAELARRASQAGQALSAADTMPIAELRQLSAELSEATASLVRGLDTASDALRRSVIRVVANASSERVAFERSWYAPLGLDPDGEDVPDLRQLVESWSAGEQLRLPAGPGVS